MLYGRYEVMDGNNSSLQMKIEKFVSVKLQMIRIKPKPPILDDFLQFSYRMSHTVLSWIIDLLNRP